MLQSVTGAAMGSVRAAVRQIVSRSGRWAWNIWKALTTAGVSRYEGEVMNHHGEYAVVGIDLASKSWADNGFAVLRFTTGSNPQWRGCSVGIDWPKGPLTPGSMARFLSTYATERQIAAVSLDGPQGWRDPRTPSTVRGVGRRCEYECQTQGKTGCRGITYPRNYLKWTSFCIDVFAALLGSNDRVRLADNPGLAGNARPGSDVLYVLECHPTDCWRSSGLVPLPGHASANESIVSERARSLREKYELPHSAVTTHHDGLQAVVAALPAVGLLGGPAIAIPRGVASRIETGSQEHRVEGLIWSARPRC